MDIDLFETTNVKAVEGDNSVNSLRKKFQIDMEAAQALQSKIEEMREDNANLQDVINSIAEISAKIEEESDTKNKAVLNKIQTRLQAMATGMTANQEHDKLVIEREKAEFKDWNQTVQDARKWLDKEPYAEAFAQLYSIQQQAHLMEENATVRFIETEDTVTSGYMSLGQHLQSSITEEEGGRIPHIGLEVDLHNGLPFKLMMEPSDRNDTRTEMKVSIDAKAATDLELDNPEKLKSNKEKIRQIMEFCERYGFSTFDLHIPMTFDGEVDAPEFYNANRPHLTAHEEQMQEMLHGMFNEVQADKHAERAMAAENEMRTLEANEEKARQAGEEIDNKNISYDAEPTVSFTVSAQSLAMEGSSYSGTAFDGTPDDGSAPEEPEQPQEEQIQPVGAVKLPNPSLKEAEKIMEELLEGKGLNKKRNVTYFKKGFFHSKWTEYVVYDNRNDEEHDGRRDKNGEAKFTYAFKLFVSVDDNGQLTFSYRFNKGDKKALINAMAGKFESMGFTHINFPEGLPDDEKGLWRTALGEKGIVWVGMKLDVDKAGAMVKAAQDKHMDADKLTLYKYRIALQMQENNAKKGKTPSEDEEDFIEGYIKSYDYNSFKKGYARGLKSILSKTLIAGDKEEGAFYKIAAYRALTQIFEIYKETLNRGSISGLRTGSIGEIIGDTSKPHENDVSAVVTPKQKKALLDLGLPADIRDITPNQLIKVYKALLDEQVEAARKEVYDILDANRLKDTKVLGARALPDTLVRNVYRAAEKRASAINTDLAAMGVDEIALPKEGQVSLGIGAYEKKVEAEQRARREAEEAARATGGTGGGTAFHGGATRSRGSMEM